MEENPYELPHAPSPSGSPSLLAIALAIAWRSSLWLIDASARTAHGYYVIYVGVLMLLVVIGTLSENVRQFIRWLF